ncbi:hypothetical protein AU255_02685 [Methyloprofundus sedimenti]|uniref:Type 4 fimbrial biogenesis protein PilX N-terminal domain-containing protein n=1 Tax=Methyloprofundus sedimenti TaxID=1420851 RepID=A0A1V8M5P4_9GAMM|nr:PilX N-terminal domain-containing pilus assembly protein [Methyloprofundus sedimenti]OQK16828.1 hypothetical protein AU255_02685 [Methyloprofundus sedimenti]
MKSLHINSKAKQQGAATILVALILMMIMAIMTLTISRTGMLEQQLVGNDIRAREAQEAAEAGLEYAIAWGTENPIASSMTCTSANETDCPTFAQVTGSTSSEAYNYTLTFTKGADAIKVTSVSQGATDTTISATSETWIKQIADSLFGDGDTMPEPWVIAGCITSAPTGNPGTFILGSSHNAVVSGTSSNAACLPQGHLDVTNWTDTNGDGVKDSGEEGASAPFNTGLFSGCPATDCAWDYAFKMSLVDAKQKATDAGHVYGGSIPCGPSGSPGIYIINNGGPINSGDISGSCSGTGVDNATIGEPGKPIVLIVPTSAGCPKFNGGVTIYGIVYYESTTACASQGWGGATVYGSVIWEGDVDKPNANTEFIEVDHGSGSSLNDVFQMSIDDATRIPGTWKDF